MNLQLRVKVCDHPWPWLCVQGPAGLCFGLAGIFGILLTRGLQRVQRLDKFEKDMRN